MSSFDFSDWVGRQQRQSDQLSATPARALAATLDREESYESGDALPGLWHWLYFLPLHRQSELGVDGHAKRGGFLPPVPLPRRMWAGGQLNWHQPLKMGESVERVSTIKSVTHKSGKTGDLVFVAVEHAISNAQGLAMTEVHEVLSRLAGGVGVVDGDTRDSLDGDADKGHGKVEFKDLADLRMRRGHGDDEDAIHPPTKPLGGCPLVE